MKTITKDGTRKADSSEKIRAKLDAEALQGSKETYARLKKEESQKVVKAPKSKI